MYAVNDNGSGASDATVLGIVQALLGAGAATGIITECSVKRDAIARAVMCKRYCAVDTMVVAAQAVAETDPVYRRVRAMFLTD